MAVKILMVLTNHDQLGNTGKKTGWYLPEVAHPYHVFKKNGYDIVMCSPKGGVAPMVSLFFSRTNYREMLNLYFVMLE